MTALEKIREWLTAFPQYAALEGFFVDYTDQIPNNGGIFPGGLVELGRRHDIVGNIRVQNQLNFAVYTVLPKAPQDDEGASFNAEWVAELQLWVQEQSVLGLAPIFGDIPREESITAQNGIMFETDEEGTATYSVQLSVTYTKVFKEENKWTLR